MQRDPDGVEVLFCRQPHTVRTGTSGALVHML